MYSWHRLDIPRFSTPHHVTKPRLLITSEHGHIYKSRARALSRHLVTTTTEKTFSFSLEGVQAVSPNESMSLTFY